jgi:hypothetical protein
MKHITYIFFSILFFMACTSTPKVEEKPAPGFLQTADGKIDAVDGNPENLRLLEKYIKAHNERNIDIIAEMDHDSISVELPDGSVVKGKETHKQVLGDWFEASDPVWGTVFAYSMKVVGQKGEWVITGHSFKDQVDGEEISEYHIADMFILDNKIRRIIVTKKDI